MMVTPIVESLCIFSKCSDENGVSRTTNSSWPRSFMTTSAARSIKLSDIPWAIDATLPAEHGQTTICFGAAEPEATGENQSSLPHTTKRSGSQFRCLTNAALAASGPEGSLRSCSVASTTLAADDINRYT